MLGHKSPASCCGSTRRSASTSRRAPRSRSTDWRQSMTDNVTRHAAVIGLQPGAIEEYERLHVEVWPAVLDRLGRSNVRNYSIYRYGTLLFSYYEHVGTDHDADMAEIAQDPQTQRWWTLTQPLQRPVDA